MPLKFNQGEYIHNDQLNNSSRAGYVFVIDGLLVEEDSPLSMDVIINSGTAFIRDKKIVFTGGTVTIPAADPLLNRVDLVVLDYTTETIQIITGPTTSADDVFPNGPLNSGSYDPDDKLVLARVKVFAGVTTITNADIIDMRVINNENSALGFVGLHPFFTIGW